MNWYVGVDIGTINLGYSIVTYSTIIESGSVCIRKRKPLPDKWHDLRSRLENVTEWASSFFKKLNGPNPPVVGIEQPFVGANRYTSMMLGMAFGCVFACAHVRSFQIEKVTPTEAKKAITGHGNASKEEVMKSALALSTKSELTQDEADAIAVAIAIRNKVG